MSSKQQEYILQKLHMYATNVIHQEIIDKENDAMGVTPAMIEMVKQQIAAEKAEKEATIRRQKEAK